MKTPSCHQPSKQPPPPLSLIPEGLLRPGTNFMKGHEIVESCGAMAISLTWPQFGVPVGKRRRAAHTPRRRHAVCETLANLTCHGLRRVLQTATCAAPRCFRPRDPGGMLPCAPPARKQCRRSRSATAVQNAGTQFDGCHQREASWRAPSNLPLCPLKPPICQSCWDLS